MYRRNGISKTVTATLMLTLLFSAVAGLTPSTVSAEDFDFAAYTHTVFAENGSATW
jgi:hypothetical protein